MKKINVIFDDSDKIEGYSNISAEQVSSLTNGTCEEIFCLTLDKYNYDARLNLIVVLCKKLSNLGLLTLKFINGTKICRDAFKGNATSRSLSSIVNQSKSIFFESDIHEIVAQIDNMIIFKTFNNNTEITTVLQKKL